LTIWLLEDEAAFAELFQEKLRQYGGAMWRYVWLRCLENALAQAAQEIPDVLIADIQLEGESGIDAARALSERFSSLKIIFLTGNPGASQDIFGVVQPYAVRHKGYDPWRYILSDLRKIAEELDSGTHRLSMTANGKTIDLPLRDISHIEHVRNDSILHLPSKQDLRLRTKLDDIMIELDNRFVRCGKSDIVNLDYVTGLEDDVFLLPGGARIPISRVYKAMAIKGFHARKGGLA